MPCHARRRDDDPLRLREPFGHQGSYTTFSCEVADGSGTVEDLRGGPSEVPSRPALELDITLGDQWLFTVEEVPGQGQPLQFHENVVYFEEQAPEYCVVLHTTSLVDTRSHRQTVCASGEVEPVECVIEALADCLASPSPNRFEDWCLARCAYHDCPAECTADGGGSGASPSSGGTPSSGGNGTDGTPSGGNADTSSNDSGGCSVTPTERHSPAWPIGALLGLAALRRRRAHRRHRPTGSCS